MAPRHGTVLRHRGAIACFLGSIVVNVAGFSALSYRQVDESAALIFLVVVLLGPAVALLGLRLEPHRSKVLNYLGAIACFLCSIVACLGSLFLMAIATFGPFFALLFTGNSEYALQLFLAALLAAAVGVLCLGEIFVGYTLWRGEDLRWPAWIARRTRRRSKEPSACRNNRGKPPESAPSAGENP
jgi:hypothetical protein